MPPRPDLASFGSTGLHRLGGRLYEEWLPELQGENWRKVLRQMTDNDPVIGAILFAIEMLVRQVSWRVEPASESTADVDLADFIEGALFRDMETSWQDTLSEIMTMLPWGWHLAETNFKIRGGESRDPTKNSVFTDGRIGWRSWSTRAQETLYRWQFDDDGRVLAMEQHPAPDYQLRTIPLTKALLFRTSTRKGSPEGRALDPETPIPTPDGWRRMDALHPGDKVFDEQGRIRYVTARAEWENRPCYRVSFGDGTSIVADEAHQWVTQLLWERSKRLPAKVRTTSEIAKTVQNSNGVSNHSISWSGALDYPKQMLPVDPYYLGYWLGDGNTRNAYITTHVDDVPELVLELAAVGLQSTVVQNGAAGGLGRLVRVGGSSSWSSDGPAHRLRAIGVIGSKHVPEAYLRGSKEQRLALLAGLMDSDGCVDAHGRCEFVNTNRRLIDGVAELVRSLGCGARVSLRHHADELKHRLDTWAVKFTPSWSPFRLARKTARTINERARMQHYIVSVEPVEPRRTVCLEVDSPSHLFLVGESMIPTHNSILRNAYTSWYYKTAIQKIEAIGIERDLAGLPVAWVPPELLASTPTAEDAAVLEVVKNLVTNIRRDEQEGIVFPLAFDEGGHKLYDLTLLSTGGTRQFDTDKVIARYDHRIAVSVLADFILLGQQAVGSFALASEKTNLFSVALGAWLDLIAGEVNAPDGGIPRLMRLNGFQAEQWPKLVHGDIESVDLAELGDYITKLSGAGLPLFPNRNLESYLLTAANLPEMSDEERAAAEEAAKQQEAAAKAAMAALQQAPAAVADPSQQNGKVAEVA